MELSSSNSKKAFLVFQETELTYISGNFVYFKKFDFCFTFQVRKTKKLTLKKLLILRETELSRPKLKKLSKT